MWMRMLAGVVLLWCAVSVADTRGMQPDDYYRFVFVNDPQLSPDGQTVAFVRATVSEDRRSRPGAIWLVDSSGQKQPTQFTFGEADSSPLWSADGAKLAFLSNRGKGQQLHVIGRDGGEARAITQLKQASIRDFSWSPNGQQMLLTLAVDPEVADPTVEKAKAAQPEADMLIIRHALYKSDGSGFLNERRRGLWLLDIESGQLTRLTGDTRWHDHSAQFSADGQQIVFASDRSDDALEGSMQQDLFIYRLADASVARVQTLPGQASQPQWSPDGSQLLYHYQADYFKPQQLVVHQFKDSTNRIVANDWDRHASSSAWLTNQQLLLGADNEGSRPLYTLDLRTNRIKVLASAKGSASAATASIDGKRISYLWQNEQQLPEVWVVQGSKAPQQLTQFNQALLQELQLPPLESFWFSHEQGRSQGFLLKPVGFNSGQSYPLILNIKGGPGGMWGHQWFHEFHMMAAAGYAVVFTNYRGSTGYGYAHQHAVHADYGGVDYRDNMAVLDHLLQQHDWLDATRLYLTGGSHGGFLTNWITTQTGRFTAAVTQRSVSNWLSEAGTQQYPPNSMRREFAGTIWQNFELYWSRSPLKYADKVSTPTLILHSTDDHITPIGQGQEWFYALKANGVPTEMVIFKGEGHSLSRNGVPVNLVARLERILDWFNRYPQPDSSQ